MFMDQQRKAPIVQAMSRYAEDGALAFHTPGHKQGLGAHPLLHELITDKGLREEVSLMEELDNLQEPDHCIREAQEATDELPAPACGLAYEMPVHRLQRIWTLPELWGLSFVDP